MSESRKALRIAWEEVATAAARADKARQAHERATDMVEQAQGRLDMFGDLDQRMAEHFGERIAAGEDVEIDRIPSHLANDVRAKGDVEAQLATLTGAREVLADQHAEATLAVNAARQRLHGAVNAVLREESDAIAADLERAETEAARLRMRLLAFDRAGMMTGAPMGEVAVRLLSTTPVNVLTHDRNTPAFNRIRCHSDAWEAYRNALLKGDADAAFVEPAADAIPSPDAWELQAVEMRRMAEEQIKPDYRLDARSVPSDNLSLLGH